MQVKLCQPAAMTLVMDGKARPGRRGECVRGRMRCPRAAQSFSCAVLGVQFRCKIDSPARPLASSLAVTRRSNASIRCDSLSVSAAGLCGQWDRAV